MQAVLFQWNFESKRKTSTDIFIRSNKNFRDASIFGPDRCHFSFQLGAALAAVALLSVSVRRLRRSNMWCSVRWWRQESYATDASDATAQTQGQKRSLRLSRRLPVTQRALMAVTPVARVVLTWRIADFDVTSRQLVHSHRTELGHRQTTACPSYVLLMSYIGIYTPSSEWLMCYDYYTC